MIEAIQNRVSTRTYEKTSLSESDLKKVNQIIEEMNNEKGPFGSNIRLFFYHSHYLQKDVDVKIGTYGFIKNAPHFIGGITKNTFKHIVDFGFIFEKLILKLTEIGLGTVWLGGTFNRKKMNHLISDDEIIPALTAVGYSKKKQTIREKTTRLLSKGNQRKPIETMFFINEHLNPIHINHELINHFECVRIAPSASNKQPWRLILKDEVVHFYLERNKNYAKILPFDIQALDIGIAIYHFVCSLEYHKHTYEYKNIETQPYDDLEYVLSVCLIK